MSIRKFPIALLPLLASSLHASQANSFVSDTRRCEDCTIRMTSRVRLHDSTNVPFGGSQSMAVDSRGRYYLYHANRTDLVSVFGPDGHLMKLLGNPGESTGRYSNIVNVHVSPGDTIHVFDGDTRRQTVLTPDYHAFRTIPIPGSPLDVVQLVGNRLVINSMIRTPDHVGFPLHLLDSNGTILQSFGIDDETYRGDVPLLLFRSITNAGDSAIWSMHRTSYRIELWDLEGRRLRRLDREVDWLRPWFRGRVFSDSAPPKSMVNGIRSTPDGFLWILIAVPNPEWKRHLESTPTADGVSVLRPTAFEAVFDTYIEVIDPARAELVAQTRVPQYLEFFVEGCLCAASYSGNARGTSGLEVMELRLENGPTNN